MGLTRVATCDAPQCVKHAPATHFTTEGDIPVPKDWILINVIVANQVHADMPSRQVAGHRYFCSAACLSTWALYWRFGQHMVTFTDAKRTEPGV